jgi:hypothetical protein
MCVTPGMRMGESRLHVLEPELASDLTLAAKKKRTFRYAFNIGGACPWVNSKYKELCGFEDLPHFVELLQLPFGSLELFFFCDDGVFEPVDLVEHHLDRWMRCPIAEQKQ